MSSTRHLGEYYLKQIRSGMPGGHIHSWVRDSVLLNGHYATWRALWERGTETAYALADQIARDYAVRP